MVDIREAISSSYRGNLPDSSFAIILPGGSKDLSGRTVPRSLRKLPYKDSNGKVIFANAVAALAALNGARGGVSAPMSAKNIAWRKIVRAIKFDRPDYVPPPKKIK